MFKHDIIWSKSCSEWRFSPLVGLVYVQPNQREFILRHVACLKVLGFILMILCHKCDSALKCQYRPKAVAIILARHTLLWYLYNEESLYACIPSEPRLALPCSRRAYLDQVLWLLNVPWGLHQLPPTQSQAPFKESWQKETTGGERSGYLRNLYQYRKGK